jgi:hypothetical protein
LEIEGEARLLVANVFARGRLRERARNGKERGKQERA